ncbi:MAG: hypothetical protein ACPGJV_07760 [Bacteriovoracaceae bacterium]
MVVNQCLEILKEMTKIEKEISKIEKLALKHGIQLDYQDLLSAIIKNNSKN